MRQRGEDNTDKTCSAQSAELINLPTDSTEDPNFQSTRIAAVEFDGLADYVGLNAKAVEFDLVLPTVRRRARSWPRRGYRAR